MRFIFMKTRALLCSFALSGCASLAAVSPTVNNDDIIATAQMCEAPPNVTINPATFMDIGFTKLDMACRAYFDRLTDITQQTRISRKALGSGNIAALAVMNATNVAAPAITITAAGVLLADQIISEFAETYAYTPYLFKIRQLVADSMSDFKTRSRAAAAAENMSFMSSDNYCKAYQYIVDYASLCTVSSIQLLFDQQIAMPSTTQNGPATKPNLKPGFFPSSGRPTPNYSVRPSS
jgi:hypothetical protein